jgi:hypothetical protein
MRHVAETTGEDLEVSQPGMYSTPRQLRSSCDALSSVRIGSCPGQSEVHGGAAAPGCGCVQKASCALPVRHVPFTGVNHGWFGMCESDVSVLALLPHGMCVCVTPWAPNERTTIHTQTHI